MHVDPRLTKKIESLDAPPRCYTVKCKKHKIDALDLSLLRKYVCVYQMFTKQETVKINLQLQYAIQ